MRCFAGGAGPFGRVGAALEAAARADEATAITVPLGVAAANGFRQFIAGTGGKSHYAMLAQKAVNNEVGNATDFGVLRLYLGDGSYSWEFVSVSGVVLDDGGPVACN